MIHQCYFEDSQRSRLFAGEVYRGFGLYSAVNPRIASRCPELATEANQIQLSEYGAMLHLWRNPELDPDPWIGFTSYRQLEKFPTQFVHKKQIADLLAEHDIVGWGVYRFLEQDEKTPIPLVAQGERAHPGVLTALCRCLELQGDTIPLAYLLGDTALFCNYWVMSKRHFEHFMEWSYPMVRMCLEQPDRYVRSHPRAISYLAERLFILWYMRFGLGVYSVAPVQQVVFDLSAAKGGIEPRLRSIKAWNLSLAELCHHHAIRPRGIIHIGAHYGEERGFYRAMGVRHVLWIEADPLHLPQLEQNLMDYPEQRAIQACLAEIDGCPTPFYRTSNAGESSSILPLGQHRVVHPEIAVVEQTTLTTTTFAMLVDRYGISVDDYDFLVLDVQGAELRVLSGFAQHLASFTGIYLEVSLEPLYEGCPLLADVDRFMGQHGFERRETNLTDRRYGDALYLRADAFPPPDPALPAQVRWHYEQVELTRGYTFHWIGHQHHEFELVSDGKVGKGASPYLEEWHIRPTGRDVVLEITGQAGRSFLFYPSLDGIWRGHSPIEPCPRAQLIPLRGVPRTPATGEAAFPGVPLHLMEQLIQDLGLSCFVENASHDGTTAAAMARHGWSVTTIDESLAISQLSRLIAQYPNVRCLIGEADGWLSRLLQTLPAPALFWLTAHRHREGAIRSKSWASLTNDVQMILAQRQDHVVLIDEAHRFFEKSPPAGSKADSLDFSRLCDQVALHRPMPFVQVVEDAILIGPSSAAASVIAYLRQTVPCPVPFDVTYPWR